MRTGQTFENPNYPFYSIFSRNYPEGAGGSSKLECALYVTQKIDYCCCYLPGYLLAGLFRPYVYAACSGYPHPGHDQRHIVIDPLREVKAGTMTDWSNQNEHFWNDQDGVEGNASAPDGEDAGNVDDRAAARTKPSCPNCGSR